VNKKRDKEREREQSGRVPCHERDTQRETDRERYLHMCDENDIDRERERDTLLSHGCLLIVFPP
jgi:hypothetical protein